jgi:hypothetical protein
VVPPNIRHDTANEWLPACRVRPQRMDQSFLRVAFETLHDAWSCRN